jgi:hypothetical protein
MGAGLRTKRKGEGVSFKFGGVHVRVARKTKL